MNRRPAAAWLLKPSFIPDRSQRELRDLTRSRTTLWMSARGLPGLCLAAGGAPIALPAALLTRGQGGRHRGCGQAGELRLMKVGCIS
jgi:hypothetical protein